MPKEDIFTIKIEQFTFETIIGILPQERTHKQKIIIDLSFEYLFDSSKKNFIDYSEITQLLQKNFNNEKFELIEEALSFSSHLLHQRYDIQNLSMKITKPDIIKDCNVSVSLIN